MRKLAKSCVCDDDDDVLLLLLAKSERISVESASAMSVFFARRFCLALCFFLLSFIPSARPYTLNESFSKIATRRHEEENNTSSLVRA